VITRSTSPCNPGLRLLKPGSRPHRWGEGRGPQAASKRRVLLSRRGNHLCTDYASLVSSDLGMVRRVGRLISFWDAGQRMPGVMRFSGSFRVRGLAGNVWVRQGHRTMTFVSGGLSGPEQRVMMSEASAHPKSSEEKFFECVDRIHQSE
jgi:hypothetical protein